jgi:hypothetical protein
LKSSCQEIKPVWRGALRKLDRRFERSCQESFQEMRPETGEGAVRIYDRRLERSCQEG